MNPSIRMLGVWSAVIFFVLWAIGYGVMAQWIPPMPPSAGAQDVADMFREDSVRIRIGMIFMILGATFYLPWTMLLSDIIKQIEGQSFFLSGTQLVAGVMSQVTFFVPAYMWAAAAFRPERNPEITQAMVDQGWIIFITGIGPFILQYAILAFAIFLDKRPVRAFPRWVAYLQIWVAISFVPALLAFFMKTGPFAWNGVFVWWIPLSLFTLWFITMIVFTRKCVISNICNNV